MYKVFKPEDGPFFCFLWHLSFMKYAFVVNICIFIAMYFKFFIYVDNYYQYYIIPAVPQPTSLRYGNLY